MEQVYATLPTLPPDFPARYHHILEIPLADTGRREVVSELEALAKEFEVLIDIEVNGLILLGDSSN